MRVLVHICVCGEREAVVVLPDLSAHPLEKELLSSMELCLKMLIMEIGHIKSLAACGVSYKSL